VAWKDGRIVGTQGTIRTTVFVHGRPEAAAWVIDFAVRKDLRRSGIGEALGAASRAERRTRLILEVSPTARGIANRAGYGAIGEVPLFVRPVDPARWLRSHGVPEPLAWLSGAASPALAALDSFALRLARSEQVELVQTSFFDGRADTIFASLATRHPVLCRRDSSWLQWRFERYPQPRRYETYWVARKGAPAGYVVLRAGTHHGAGSGVLVDYLCDPGILRAVLGLCLERFRAAGAAVATCLHLNPSASGAFRRLGFLRRNSGWRFLVRPEPPALGPAILDARNWFLTGADSNIDRERGPL
jgi:ribosomal protein S18 acetylase RimI-like enzyme